MAEQATPTPGTEQAPSVESRLDRFITRHDAEEAEGAQPEPAQRPEGQAGQELTLDDLPPDVETQSQQPGTVDDRVFEIEWQGQKRKLTQAEMVQHAQQGFDYTQKTMVLATAAKQLQDRLVAISAAEQAVPQLEVARGQVMAALTQLQPYQNVDWVKWATEDPIEYAKGKASYDALSSRAQQAVGQFQTLQQAIGQQTAAISQQQLLSESRALVERIPEWKDPEKYKTGANELRTYLLSEGASPSDVDALTSSVAVAVAYKAMKYDRLLKQKGEKVKQLREAPPMSRPGAAQNYGSNTEKVQKLTQRLKKSGSLEDAAALLLNRMK